MLASSRRLTILRNLRESPNLDQFKLGSFFFLQALNECEQRHLVPEMVFLLST